MKVKRKLSPGRRRKFRIAAVLLGIVLAFTVGEAAVRLKFMTIEPERRYEPGIYRSDPELGWKLTANYVGNWLARLHMVPTVTDARGFRMEPDEFEAYHKAKRRVICIGDSITFGLGVHAKEAYPQQLQALLRERKVDAAVANLGIPGYDTRQERILLERIIEEYKPHLVVAGWFWNDITNPSVDVLEETKVIDGYLVNDEAAFRTWSREKNHLYPWDWSALLRYIEVKYRVWRHARKTVKKRARQAEKLKWKPEDIEANQEELRRIRDIAKRHGAEFMLTLYASKELIHDEKIPAEVYDKYVEFGEREQVPVVNLRKAFIRAHKEAADPDLFVLADMSHPSARGFRVAAEATLEKVRSVLDK